MSAYGPSSGVSSAVPWIHRIRGSPPEVARFPASIIAALGSSASTRSACGAIARAISPVPAPASSTTRGSPAMSPRTMS
jgi:hypothetical protein